MCLKLFWFPIARRIEPDPIETFKLSDRVRRAAYQRFKLMDFCENHLIFLQFRSSMETASINLS